MLYIMRHGKTEWNALKRLQGRTDIPLNDEGRAMAIAAAEEYKDVHFDICYCSPQVRALETAELVLKGRNIQIVPDDRLKEMCFGVCEGMTINLREPGCPVYSFFREPENYIEPVDEGESFKELYKRTGEFLEDVIKPGLKKGLDILIVGHGAMNSSIICQVRELPIKDFWKEGIENCKLKRLI